mmetsp:Transcript_3036/g.4604  ORF Transcript_3036/g.4604 Transcript_3036/m.4604 type:complete len:554 (-) Transcript_3036:470-2131(-)
MTAGFSSSSRRWILFAFSLASVALATGLIYGWPALRRQLVQDDGSDLDEKQLGAVFTVGAWSTQAMRFFFGMARDRFGTQRVTFVSFVLVALGLAGVALSDPSDGIVLAVSLFAIGCGSGVQICIQPVAGLFPSYSGTILSSLSGAFQVSGVIFLVLCSGDGSRQPAFLMFTACLSVFAVFSLILLPKGKSFILEEDNVDEKSTQQGQTKIDDETARLNRSKNIYLEEINGLQSMQVEHVKTDVDYARMNMRQWRQKNMYLMYLEEAKEEKYASGIKESSESTLVEDQQPLTALQQMKSLEYILLIFWFSVCVFPLQYYVGSIGFQLEGKGDDDGFYTSLFSVVYASSAVIAPAGGYLADTAGLGKTQGISTILLAASFLVLALDTHLYIQSIGLFLYACARMFVYGMYFSNLGKRFGFKNYGTLAGSGLLISAIVSLLQYPLIAAAVEGNADKVNFALVVVCLSLLPYCYWVHRREKSLGNPDQKGVHRRDSPTGILDQKEYGNDDNDSGYSWENDSEYSCSPSGILDQKDNEDGRGIIDNSWDDSDSEISC